METASSFATRRMTSAGLKDLVKELAKIGKCLKQYGLALDCTIGDVHPDTVEGFKEEGWRDGKIFGNVYQKAISNIATDTNDAYIVIRVKNV